MSDEDRASDIQSDDDDGGAVGFNRTEEKEKIMKSLKESLPPSLRDKDLSDAEIVQRITAKIAAEEATRNARLKRIIATQKGIDELKTEKEMLERQKILWNDLNYLREEPMKTVVYELDMSQERNQCDARFVAIAARQALSGSFVLPSKQTETYSASTGNKYFLLDMNSAVREIDPEDESRRKCDNCFRYMFLFSNTPCVLACGHSFCEMCIRTAKEIRCVPCNKTYKTSDEKKYIVNKSLSSLYNNYAESYGIERPLDLVYRNTRHVVATQLGKVFAYLPIWVEQQSKVLRLQTTLAFWCEEKRILLDDKQLDFKSKFPKLLLQEKIKLAEFMKIFEGSLANLNKMLIQVKHEHGKEIQTIPRTLSTKGLDLSPVFKRYDKLYFSTYINGERFYMKMSGGHEFVFLHSGFWAKSRSRNFAKDNLIFESSKQLDEIRDLFMDVTFQYKISKKGKVVKKEHKKRLCLIRDNKGDYAERMFSLFTGQWNTFKGIVILNDNANFIISEPGKKSSIFEVPSISSLNDKAEPIQREQLRKSAVVSFNKNNTYNLAIITDNENGVEYYARSYLQVRSFGRLKTGVSFLNTMSNRQLNRGKIEDCGLILPWKLL